MRSLLNLFAIGALSISCTSGLWGPFAEDTKWNCNITPCAEGQTCNQLTGFCEGGGSVDMGTVNTDMQTPTFSREETVFRLTTGFYFNMAIADLVDDAEPEIFLSGDYGTQQDAILLKKNSKYSQPQTISTIPGSQFITSVAPYRYSAAPQDVVAVAMNINTPSDQNGQLLHFYKNGTTVAIKQTALGLRGFKVVSVGYVPDDGIPDIAITSSVAPIATAIYPTNGATGEALIFTGQAAAVPRNSFSGGASVPGGAFSFVTLLPQAPTTAWANNIIFSGAGTKPVPGTTVELLRDKNGSPYQSLPVQMATDLALIADMDHNGTNDLVLIALRPPNSSTLRVSFNSGTNFMPVFGNPLITIEDGSGNIGAATSVNLFDFDGDGFLDIGVGMYQRNAFLLLQNRSDERGGRLFQSFRTVNGASGARALAYDDMDGDGCKDLVAMFGGEAGKQGGEVQILYSRCK